MDSYKHCDELFTFLDVPAVPADNNDTEQDIRSLAAARSDRSTRRADWECDGVDPRARRAHLIS
ncbi:MAG: hypothetical protein P4L84_01605 [Isosphaeraceae bacterium]|nr:hypothetical protein [Isosphaeraceae bacterium]